MESILQTSDCLHIYHAQHYMPIAISFSYQVMNYNLKVGDITVTWQLFFSHQLIPSEKDRSDVNPCFIKSHLISHLSYGSCDFWVKS